ncbi:MAG: hypothetical protein K2O98_01255 [Lachnospiraceae bacterium]|nr:hypothetical protein [Lachnospiraceae bacterium]GFI49729.1 hypothetical protein IMSAGC020_00929 [Lachnospiraceae bacterium]
MAKEVNAQTTKDKAEYVMDLLIMLLEDQTGKSYEYKMVSNPDEETA